MPRRTEIPPELKKGPFTSAYAASCGITQTVLRGTRFRRLFRGVYVWIDVQLTLIVWLRGALLVLPKGTIVSHFSALWLYGVEVGTPTGFEFSTNRMLVTKLKRVTLHRRLGRLTAYGLHGLAVTGPDRTLVDCATRLTAIQFVQAADWMIHRGRTTIESLMEFALNSHIDGVVRARRWMLLVREGAESPMETLVRLMLVFARLPEPECNRNICDESGNVLARGDLVYFRFKVLVEYDGWQHERDARQRQRDRERRELLEAEGWRVIVITSADLKRPSAIPWRVYEALKAKGYEGRPPLINAMWTQWFA